MKRIHTHTALRHLPLLNALSPRAIDLLEDAASCVTLEPGEFLYHQGDPATGVYIVIEGGVRLVETTPEGQCVHLKVYGRGDLFGALAIADASPHPTGAQAVGAARVAVLPGPTLRALIASSSEIGLFLIDHLVNHVQHAHARIRQLAAERVERRLARAIMHYADKFGSAVDEVIVIDVPLTQKDLADFIGTTPETVNRILKTWEQRRVIRCARQHIDVLDADFLRAHGENLTYMGQVL
ncbi:MAG: Crp/Fnr family transcriptional regulator [Candidatus Flexifilum sp.]|jgi:CRP-like cAMP-binding protein